MEYTYSELFTQKLMDLGLSRQQAQSKSVAATLTILANTDEAIDAYQEICQLRDSLERQEEEARQELSEHRRVLHAQQDEVWKLKREYEMKLSQMEEITQFETPEARDRYRLAEYYKQNTTRKNVFQETEFNKGLALILSGVKEGDKE